MSCILGLFDSVGHGIEEQLRPFLSGFTGVLVRSYLPQQWVFETEQETGTFGVDSTGRTWIRAGGTNAPDITVKTSHARLERGLKTRDRSSVPPGPFEVTAHTPKGRTAFDLLAKRIGLAA